MSEPPTPILPPNLAITLIDKEIGAVENRFNSLYNTERRTHILWGEVQEFYQSVYNILSRSFGKEHRVTQHFVSLYRSKHPSCYDELETLLGAAKSARKELSHSVLFLTR
jgi:hypothetical protein